MGEPEDVQWSAAEGGQLHVVGDVIYDVRELSRWERLWRFILRRPHNPIIAYWHDDDWTG